MQDSFTIKNFRVFNEKGATIPFKPITLLTGSNGSGKSSIAKAIMMLHDYFKLGFDDQAKHQRRYYDPTSYPLDFTKSNLKLGGFNTEVNRESKDKEIGFSYSYSPSVAPLCDLTIDYYFTARDIDKLNQGWLSRINVKSKNSNDEYEKILSVSVNKNGLPVVDFLNLNNAGLVYSFLRFFVISNIIHIHELQKSCYDINGDLLDEERFEQLENTANLFMAEVNKFDVIYNTEVDSAKSIFSRGDMQGDTATTLYPHLFDKSLLDSWKKCCKNSIFFYFPIFDELKGLTKDVVCERLRKAEFYIPSHDMRDNSLANEIANDFNASEYDSFIDYYRDKENDKLNDVVNHTGLYIKLPDNDLINRIIFESEISFDNTNLIASKKGGVDFAKLYRFLSNWQWKLTPNLEDDYCSRFVESDNMFSSSHKLYSAYKEYIGILFYEILLPQSFCDIHYIGTSNAMLKRLYSFDEKENPFTKRLMEYNEAERVYRIALQEKPFGRVNTFNDGDFINKWIKKLKIGDSLRIDIDRDSLGAKVFLKKSPDDTGISLADEGFGINQIIALLISIETEILRFKADLLKNEVTPVFGQPEPAPYEPHHITVIIEEPEVNLHPAFQSKLADMFHEAYSKYNINFIVETHSEYLIRKIQTLVASKTISPDDIALLYVEDNVTVKEDGVKKVREISIKEDGRLAESFGAGFFDEADNLAMNLLKIKSGLQ